MVLHGIQGGQRMADSGRIIGTVRALILVSGVGRMDLAGSVKRAMHYTCSAILWDIFTV